MKEVNIYKRDVRTKKGGKRKRAEFLNDETTQKEDLDHRSSYVSRHDQEVNQEYELSMFPFQLHLLHVKPCKMSDAEEMMLFSTTHQYLSSILRDSKSSFSNLDLYQFVRNYPDSKIDTKVAFSGKAYFFAPNRMDQNELELSVMLGLMGENSTKFLSSLQDMGMTNIRNATLMSMEGKAIQYHGGKFIGGGFTKQVEQQNGPLIHIGSTRQMNQEMKMTTLLISILIPALTLCLVSLLFVVRLLRGLNYPRRKVCADSVAWRSCYHRDKEVRDASSMNYGLRCNDSEIMSFTEV